MSTAKATPRPWYLLDQKLRPQLSSRILEIKGPDREPVVHWTGFDAVDRSKAVRKANAKLIVRAVNAHDELITTLQRWADWWDGNPDDDDSVPALLSDTKAVLAKARGEDS